MNAGRLSTLMGLCIAASSIAAADPRGTEPVQARPANLALSASADSAPITKDELATRYPEIEPTNIRDAVLPGFYEVLVGSNVYYITTDGQYLVRGDVVDLRTQHNVSEDRRSENRAQLLASIDPTDAIVFSPANGSPKYRVTVFTDVDCAYCRKFHRQIAEVNALGIEVRYVAYPRSGPDTESWAKAENVWCAADRRAALTQAKLGASMSRAPECEATPIAEQYELGHRVGLTGTPGVYADNGVELGGYLPPNELLAALERIHGQK